MNRNNIGEGKSVISSLYVLKAIGAFLVVACHAPLKVWPVGFVDLGVPIFLIITGYFLYSPDSRAMAERCLSTVRKVLPMLLILTGVYYLVEPLSKETLANPLMWIRWVLVSIPNKFGGPLWYLTAMLWGMLALYAILRVFKGKYIGGLVPLVLLGCVLGPYRFLFTPQESSYFVFNFVNYALPGFAIGILIRKHSDRLLASSRVLALLPVALILLRTENWILSEVSNGLATIGPRLIVFPAAALLFLFFLYVKDIPFTGMLRRIGESYSGNIYYWHMVFVALLSKLSTHFDNAFYYQEFGVIYVFCLAWAFSYLVVWAQKKIGVNIFK